MWGEEVHDDSWRKVTFWYFLVEGDNCNFMFPLLRHLSGVGHATFSSKSKHFTSHTDFCDGNIFMLIALSSKWEYKNKSNADFAVFLVSLSGFYWASSHLYFQSVSHNALCFHCDSYCPHCDSHCLLCFHCVFTFWPLQVIILSMEEQQGATEAHICDTIFLHFYISDTDIYISFNMKFYISSNTKFYISSDKGFTFLSTQNFAFLTNQLSFVCHLCFIGWHIWDFLSMFYRKTIATPHKASGLQIPFNNGNLKRKKGRSSPVPMIESAGGGEWGYCFCIPPTPADSIYWLPLQHIYPCWVGIANRIPDPHIAEASFCFQSLKSLPKTPRYPLYYSGKH